MVCLEPEKPRKNNGLWVCLRLQKWFVEARRAIEAMSQTEVCQFVFLLIFSHREGLAFELPAMRRVRPWVPTGQLGNEELLQARHWEPSALTWRQMVDSHLGGTSLSGMAYFVGRRCFFHHASTPGGWKKRAQRAWGFVGGSPQYMRIKPWNRTDARLDSEGAYSINPLVSLTHIHPPSP